jgi:hypothetical protein
MNQNIYINMNRNKYNPYLINNPQLAYNLNKKKYYLYVIEKNKKIMNKPFSPYTPLYFNTAYDRIYFPQRETIFT